MQITDWLTAVSIVIGVVFYIIDKFIIRREKTNKELNVLFDVYNEKIPHEKKDKDYYIKTRRFLGRIERFSIGINSHVYSKRTLRKYGSKFFVKLYDDNKEYIIDRTRKDFKDENKFMYFEKLAIKFKRENKTKGK